MAGHSWRHHPEHGLSQQGVWVPFWTPKPLKITPQDTQIFLCWLSKNPNFKLIIEFFHLLIIPMTLFNDIMPYFDEFIHVYGWNMSILWSPFKIWTPKNFTIANFRHPVSKSWLRHWSRTIRKWKDLTQATLWGVSELNQGRLKFWVGILLSRLATSLCQLALS